MDWDFEHVRHLMMLALTLKLYLTWIYNMTDKTNSQSLHSRLLIADDWKPTYYVVRRFPLSSLSAFLFKFRHRFIFFVKDLTREIQMGKWLGLTILLCTIGLASAVVLSLFQNYHIHFKNFHLFKAITPTFKNFHPFKAITPTLKTFTFSKLSLPLLKTFTFSKL